MKETCTRCGQGVIFYPYRSGGEDGTEFICGRCTPSGEQPTCSACGEKPPRIDDVAFKKEKSWRCPCGHENVNILYPYRVRWYKYEGSYATLGILAIVGGFIWLLFAIGPMSDESWYRFAAMWGVALAGCFLIGADESPIAPAVTRWTNGHPMRSLMVGLLYVAGWVIGWFLVLHWVFNVSGVLHDEPSPDCSTWTGEAAWSCWENMEPREQG